MVQPKRNQNIMLSCYTIWIKKTVKRSIVNLLIINTFHLIAIWRLRGLDRSVRMLHKLIRPNRLSKTRWQFNQWWWTIPPIWVFNEHIQFMNKFKRIWMEFSKEFHRHLEMTNTFAWKKAFNSRLTECRESEHQATVKLNDFVQNVVQTSGCWKRVNCANHRKENKNNQNLFCR